MSPIALIPENKHRLAYVELPAAVTGFAAAYLTDLQTTIVLPARRRIRVLVKVSAQQQTSIALQQVKIYEDDVEVQRVYFDTPTSTAYANHTPIAIRTPAAGSHTYKVHFATGAGSMNISATDHSTYLSIEDVGGV